MPKNLYCWRCDMIIPMLTEEEWDLVEPALAMAMSDLKEYRKVHGVSLIEAKQRAFGARALKLYQKITGFEETNSNAIWHHRASLYGPPCEACGKPLRTPNATSCAACGMPAPTAEGRP